MQVEPTKLARVTRITSARLMMWTDCSGDAGTKSGFRFSALNLPKLQKDNHCFSRTTATMRRRICRPRFLHRSLILKDSESPDSCTGSSVPSLSLGVLGQRRRRLLDSGFADLRYRGKASPKKTRLNNRAPAGTDSLCIRRNDPYLLPDRKGTHRQADEQERIPRSNSRYSYVGKRPNIKKKFERLSKTDYGRDLDDQTSSCTPANNEQVERQQVKKSKKK